MGATAAATGAAPASASSADDSDGGGGGGGGSLSLVIALQEELFVLQPAQRIQLPRHPRAASPRDMKQLASWSQSLQLLELDTKISDRAGMLYDDGSARYVHAGLDDTSVT